MTKTFRTVDLGTFCTVPRKNALIMSKITGEFNPLGDTSRVHQPPPPFHHFPELSLSPTGTGITLTGPNQIFTIRYLLGLGLYCTGT